MCVCVQLVFRQCPCYYSYSYSYSLILILFLTLLNIIIPIFVSFIYLFWFIYVFCVFWTCASVGVVWRSNQEKLHNPTGLMDGDCAAFGGNLGFFFFPSCSLLDVEQTPFRKLKKKKSSHTGTECAVLKSSWIINCIQKMYFIHHDLAGFIIVTGFYSNFRPASWQIAHRLKKKRPLEYPWTRWAPIGWEHFQHTRWRSGVPSRRSQPPAARLHSFGEIKLSPHTK